MRGFALVFALSAVLSQPVYAFDWSGEVEIAAEDLRSSDPRKRASAVERLGQYDIRWTKRHLLRALTDPDIAVRLAAARILGLAKEKAAVSHVTAWLVGAQTEEKKVAAEVLGSIGDGRATPSLIRALGDVDQEVRLRAVVALGQIGGRAVIVPLIARLEDDKPEVRRAAVAQLRALGDRRAVVPLVGSFTDSSMQVRVEAIAAVGHLGDKSAVPTLLRLLDDPMENIRVNAVSALGHIGAESATQALIERLASGSNEFRAKVAFALGQIARNASPEVAARAVTALVSVLDNARVRTAAREALRTAGDAAVPALVAKLDEPTADPQVTVALLRDLKDPRATAALVAELSRTRLPKTDVLDALGAAGDRRALVPILSLLETTDDEVRIRAMRALGHIVEPGGRGSDVVAARLTDSHPEVRALAAAHLGRMRARAQVPALLRRVKRDADISAKNAAMLALGEIGDKRATAALLGQLASGPKRVHFAAANALSYLADPAAIEPLAALAARESHASRPLVLAALGATLRRQNSLDGAERTLERLAQRGSEEVAVAAIFALAAPRDSDAASTLKNLARSPSVGRRTAALRGLGDLPGDHQSTLLTGLSSANDRVAATAAWALGKAKTAPVSALLRATRRSGFATPVNASAALARTAGPKARKRMLRLLSHRHRLVRGNACMWAARHPSPEASKALAKLLVSDPSWHVRRNAARALSRQKASQKVLTQAGKEERHETVREAIAQAEVEAFQMPKRNDWQRWVIVDPAQRDKPVRHAAYFLIAADGLATAYYTDENGDILEEAFPDGPHQLEPAGRERAY